MEFIEEIGKNEYEEFVSNNKHKSHFLQSYLWGKFNEKQFKIKVHFVGVKKSNELIVTMMLLEKKLPFGFSYLYAPRGPVMNLEDKETLTFLINNVKIFAKKIKAIFVKFDPDYVIYKEDTNKKIIIPKDQESLKVYNYLINIKDIKHLGFTKNFESFQPRYTYRINLLQDENTIIKNFKSTTKNLINRASKFNNRIVKKHLDGLDEFYSLMEKTEKRKNFIGHSYKYYKTLCETYDNYNIYLEYANIKGIINYYKNAINENNSKISRLKEKNRNVDKQINELENQINSFEKKLNEYNNYYNKIGNEVLLNAHFIIYYGNKAWALYAANEDIMQDAGTNFELYKKHILEAKEKGYQIYDHFGCVDKNSNDKNLIGLNDMKKEFGGDYIEFIGEFDLITNKLMYFIFNKIIPLYRKIVNKRLKNKLKTKKR